METTDEIAVLREEIDRRDLVISDLQTMRALMQEELEMYRNSGHTPVRTEEVDACQNCSCCSYDLSFTTGTCEAGDFRVDNVESVSPECPLRNGPILLRLKEGV
jgi:hypothetical protein